MIIIINTIINSNNESNNNDSNSNDNTDLGMMCRRWPAPMLSPMQIKKKEAQAGDEKPAQR